MIAVGFTACDKKEKENDTSGANKEVEIKQEDSFLGESFDVEKEIDLAKLVSEMDDSDSLDAVVEAKVTEVCQAKGCWMKVELPNGESMRVTFKDYGFFMPKDLAGKSVKMNGVAKIEETDLETLKHFAEDAGKPKEEIEKITEPRMDYKFVASGVKLVD
jgi:HD superfamily phosphodiesterase